MVWVGDDANKVTGFSGSRGALSIWAPLMAALQNKSYDPPLPAGMEQQWVDFNSGLGALPGCGDAVMLPLPVGTRLPMRPECVLPDGSVDAPDERAFGNGVSGVAPGPTSHLLIGCATGCAVCSNSRRAGASAGAMCQTK